MKTFENELRELVALNDRHATYLQGRKGSEREVKRNFAIRDIGLTALKTFDCSMLGLPEHFTLYMPLNSFEANFYYVLECSMATLVELRFKKSTAKKVLADFEAVVGRALDAACQHGSAEAASSARCGRVAKAIEAAVLAVKTA